MTEEQQIKDVYTHGMELLVTTVQELSLARDMETLMKIVRTTARQLTGADGATFILLENDNCYYADEDAISPLWKGHRFPIQNCVSGWAMINRQAAVIPDIYDDPRVPVDAYRPTFVKSMVMVPVRRMDPIGAIGNYWAVMRTPSKEEIKLLQSLADITAVTMENIKIHNDLEKRVDERTAELKASNENLEGFSYSVSHDLRAPLRAIRGYIDIIISDHSGGMPDKGKELFKKVSRNAENMWQIIDDLLTLYTMDKAPLDIQTATMIENVSAICSQCREAEPMRNIEFTIKDLYISQVDVSMMHHVWSNIIYNAVKYSGKREKTIIEIGSEIRDNMVVYHVSDNGAGFDMAYYSQLFEVFKRLHGQKEFEGTGIGLAIVAKIISKHGGEVWAESEVDKGSTFYFSIPRDKRGISGIIA